MDQFEIIWILVIVIGALNYDLNASGSNSLLTGAFLFVDLGRSHNPIGDLLTLSGVYFLWEDG